jgi:hypothetical protein
MKGTPLGINPAPLFDDVTGPGIETVGGEFQPSFATVHPGGGAHLFSVLHSIFVLKPLLNPYSEGRVPVVFSGLMKTTAVST